MHYDCICVSISLLKRSRHYLSSIMAYKNALYLWLHVIRALCKAKGLMSYCIGYTQAVLSLTIKCQLKCGLTGEDRGEEHIFEMIVGKLFFYLIGCGLISARLTSLSKTLRTWSTGAGREQFLKKIVGLTLLSVNDQMYCLRGIWHRRTV